MQFSIENGYSESKTKRVSLKPNKITVLVGRNGHGKSSFLSGIESKFAYSDDTIIVKWNDDEYGRSNALSNMLFNDDIEGVASMAFHSEGQKMRYSFGKFFIQRAGAACRRKTKDQHTIFLLLDQLDSGLDYHQINLFKDILRNTIIPDMMNRGLTVYCIISANSYEMVDKEDCLDPVTRKHIKFKSIDEYKEYIDSQYSDDEE